MPRIKKLELDEWDNDLEEGTNLLFEQIKFGKIKIKIFKE